MIATATCPTSLEALPLLKRGERGATMADVSLLTESTETVAARACCVKSPRMSEGRMEEA